MCGGSGEFALGKVPFKVLSLVILAFCGGPGVTTTGGPDPWVTGTANAEGMMVAAAKKQMLKSERILCNE